MKTRMIRVAATVFVLAMATATADDKMFIDGPWSGINVIGEIPSTLVVHGTTADLTMGEHRERVSLVWNVDKHYFILTRVGDPRPYRVWLQYKDGVRRLMCPECALADPILPTKWTMR